MDLTLTVRWWLMLGGWGLCCGSVGYGLCFWHHRSVRKRCALLRDLLRERAKDAYEPHWSQ